VKSSFVIVLSLIALIATLVAQGSRLQKETICDSLIAIDLKNNAQPQSVLNYLYKL
jgi:hypothetical protein